MNLRTIFCREEPRTVGNDWVVRYKNRLFQIGLQSNLPPARRRVMVQEHLDGSVHMVYRDKNVLFTEIKELPRRPVITRQKQKLSTQEEICTSSKSSPEERLLPSSTYRPDITCMRSPEVISNELKWRTFLSSLDISP
jgi:hypothetical protein